MLNSTALDDLARRLADSVPESVRAFGRDLEGNFKAVLQAQLARLDLVTRQDFDVQSAILARTQASLKALEDRLKEIEALLAEPEAAGGTGAGGVSAGGTGPAASGAPPATPAP